MWKLISENGKETGHQENIGNIEEKAKCEKNLVKDYSSWHL